MGVEWGHRVPRCGICHVRHLSLIDQVRGDGFCSVCHRAHPVVVDRASTGWVARFKLRRPTESASVGRPAATRGGPGTSPHAFDESACAGEAGAASSGEGRGLLSARTPVCPSPVSDRG